MCLVSAGRKLSSLWRSGKYSSSADALCGTLPPTVTLQAGGEHYKIRPLAVHRPRDRVRRCGRGRDAHRAPEKKQKSYYSGKRNKPRKSEQTDEQK